MTSSAGGWLAPSPPTFSLPSPPSFPPSLPPSFLPSFHHTLSTSPIPSHPLAPLSPTYPPPPPNSRRPEGQLTLSSRCASIPALAALTLGPALALYPVRCSEQGARLCRPHPAKSVGVQDGAGGIEPARPSERSHLRARLVQTSRALRVPRPRKRGLTHTYTSILLLSLLLFLSLRPRTSPSSPPPPSRPSMSRPEQSAEAPKGTSKSTFVDTFESNPGTPSERTGHVFPSVNGLRRNMTDGSGQPLKKLMVANRGVSSVCWRVQNWQDTLGAPPPPQAEFSFR